MRKILLFLSFCFMQVFAFGQTELKGLVQSELGEALTGVSIVNESQKVTTKSGSSGEFTITAKVGDVLKISSIGYLSKTQYVENLNFLTVILSVNDRSEEHTSELQSRENLVCRLLLEKKKNKVQIK